MRGLISPFSVFIEDEISRMEVIMINSNIYNYIDILDKAADAAYARNEVINNNIANVNTPNYKRKDVEFDTMLMTALSGSGTLDKRVAEMNEHLEDFNSRTYTDNGSLTYTKDGNNVDIDTESAYLAENQIRYEALVDQMSQEFGRYNMVLNG